MIQIRFIVTMVSGRRHTGTWVDSDLDTPAQLLDNKDGQVRLVGDLLHGTVLRMEEIAKTARDPMGPRVVTPARTVFLHTQHIEEIELQVREVRSGETTTHVEPTDEPDADVLG